MTQTQTCATRCSVRSGGTTVDGNIATAPGGGLQTTYTYVQDPGPLAPLLLSAQAPTVTTDSAGLTTSVTGGTSPWAYRYDSEGRLASVCRWT